MLQRRLRLRFHTHLRRRVLCRLLSVTRAAMTAHAVRERALFAQEVVVLYVLEIRYGMRFMQCDLSTRLNLVGAVVQNRLSKS
jgi:hypothetical protein